MSYAERVTSALPRDAVRNVVLVALVLAIAPVPVLGSSYYEGVLAHMVIFAMFAVALNIVFGQTDQLFLFMGGLAGIGGYGTALLADWTGISPWITLLISALVAALLGLVVSWISARRKFTVVLISILTLNLQLVLVEIYGGARDITRGSTGFPYEYLTFEGVAEAVGISEEVALYYFALLLLVGLLLVYVWLVNSRFGVAFHAIREDDLAASSIGIDVVRYKVVAGTVAAFAFGLVGAVYVQEANYILPADFAFLTVDVIVLIVLIVGGLRTTLGPVVGAAIVVAMEEILVANFTQWRSAIFGLLLIFLFLYFRSGVVPAVADLVENLGALRGEPADEPTG
ncbi:MAG TPA: branched-chain amino acid ABC transporter permease [Halobacteriales archaeon]|nr:branched-chain amino acid ABC transporter permease [Halobacteriales archaeon]